MFSEFEDKIINSLKKEFGAVYEEMDEVIVMDKVRTARQLYEKAVDDFRVNQSAHNYNMLVLGMVTLQYWNQKKTRLFSITEEF